MLRTFIFAFALGVLALVLSLAGQVTTAPAAEQTRVFQQGLDGYAGVRDTWVSTHDWDTPPQHTVNYGQNENLVLSRNDGDNPLLRFDLSSIPANSAVISATLALYNTTQSSFSGTQDFARRVRLFQVLRDWDEGNQVQSPIDAPGKHGATGDHAFDYYTGEGTDVPWGARGMAAGADYASTPESYADVVNAGWYTWDVTALVRAWVRGEQPNYGLVLRDATGYEDDHRDDRIFVSSQATADTSRHPKLTVVYNPDVPFADAGPDQENLTWDGSAVTLDGSGSQDRPGGDDASLTYAWRIVEAAYGSALAPLTLIGGGAGGGGQIISFTPDVPGEWEIELTVTNNVGESATDRVHLQLLSIPAGHPRIYLTPARLTLLQARAVPSNSRWTQLLGEADAGDGEMHAKALVSQITGQTAYCDQAITAALALISDPADWASKAGDIALVYDWCYARLSATQRTAFIDYFNAWGDDTPKSEDFSGWGNYWPRYGYSYALMGLATYGDNPRAGEWLDEFRHRRYRDRDLPLLEHIADGGGWPEGMIYDWIANPPRVKALEAWRTAAGENLFLSTDWYRERLGYLLLHRWPGVAEQWGYQYHPYLSTGDSERNRGSIANYGRIMALILVERFPDEPLARQLQAYLAAPPTNNSDDFLYHEEFLWFNPDQPSETPDRLTHYAPGTGTLFMRSGWPDGAADTDPGATYITFQAGDHFSYHQHYDQNSFTLFKYGDLALDSGVYSEDGLSNHDINYYVRTIAHNTLVVYNPDEDFSAVRADASSNDGGQRTVYPASRSPESVEYFDQHAVHYDTADMLRFEDTPYYTYALGDATKAYNNPTYNQAVDTALNDNVAKVSRFQREFVYLRPATNGKGMGENGRGKMENGRGNPFSNLQPPISNLQSPISNPQSPISNLQSPISDYVVLFDRVGVTDPAFSGANTKLLFHTLNEAVVNGTPTVVSPGETLYSDADLATAVSGDGKLFIKTLLPATRNIRKVGGRGVKAFWVFDANYDWHWDSDEPQPRPINDFEDVPYGEWRLELEPADAALEHNFLTVLYPTSSDTAAMPATTLVTGTGLAGAHIADLDLNRVALFSSAADGSALAGTLSYSYQPTAQALNLLFDLTPGARYRLTASLDVAVQTVTLVPDAGGPYQVSSQGVLSFTLEAGGAPSNTPTPTPTSTPTATQPDDSSCPDLNDDGSVGTEDVQTVAALWRTATSDPRFDQDGDGGVTVHDVMLVAARWGESCLATTPTATPTPTPTSTRTSTAAPTGTPTATGVATGTPTPTATLSQTQPPPQVAGCAVFPADNIWNTPVDNLPVAPNSNAYIATIGADAYVHPDFGAGLWEGGPIGIPYVDVPGTQPEVSVTFTYADESDPGPYPIPTDAPIEGGPGSDGDRHVLVVERDNCVLYELFYAWPQPDGSWEAGSGAIFNLSSNALRPAGWTSADAAGLPILAGLVRYDEVATGEIRHALRFTAPQTRRAYVWPARHYASSLTGSQYPPMGQRFRLRADFDISGFSPEVQVILRALKKYGMILADNGSSWYISGAPDERWDNDVLRELRQVHGSDFEAVDVSSLMVDPDSGQVRGAATPTATSTSTPTSTATSTEAATATPTSTPTSTPTATTPSGTPTVTPTPTATGTVVAADLFVDDDNTTGTENGTAQYPYNTVQEAINAAGSGDTIAVASGTYAQNIRVQDKAVHLYGGYVGGTAADYAGGTGGNFSNRDPAANTTHIQGDGTDSAVTLINAGTATVDGFRITGGSRSVEEPWYNLGGGLYVSGGAPTISHNVIENNDTRNAASPENENVGGGIYAADSDVSILDNLIRNNTSGRGAGIAIDGGTVLIRGNTVQGNIGVSDHGGGLEIASPAVTISHNRIVGNEVGRALGYGWGGGVDVSGVGSSATLAHNVITDNYAPSMGSGVFIDDGATATLDHELIYGNQCTQSGGVGIYVDGAGEGDPGDPGSTAHVIHSTVADHDCDTWPGGNGLMVERNSQATVTNSIFWGHGGDDFWVDETSTLSVTYTTSEEAIAGAGNLTADPLFADAANGDYHLQSTAGRWDPSANGGRGGWVVDANHSPAIDAGDPASDYASEPSPNGGRANMGVYGNTAEASKSSAGLLVR